MNIPRLFVQYSKSHPRLIRQRSEFVHFLSGGMAVKLFLWAQKITPNARVKTTSDFDFVFAVPEKLTAAQVNSRFKLMDRLMAGHVRGFANWLGKKYKIPAVVTKNVLVPPVQYNPITKKRIYKVIQFNIEIPGMKPEGLVDATLTYIPGVRRDQLFHKYTSAFGMPIQRVKYMYKGILAVLAGSFSSFAIKDKSLASRNPLTGSRSEKGIKNAARIANLMKVQTSVTTAAKKLIGHIKAGNVEKAYRAANKVVKNLAATRSIKKSVSKV
jgi:hypothetical protein